MIIKIRQHSGGKSDEQKQRPLDLQTPSGEDEGSSPNS
jgi:hypothetical protein